VQSRVSGQASKFIESWLQADDSLSSSDIIQKLESTYADPSFKTAARSQYHNLKQGTLDVTVFLHQFRSLAVQAGISKEDQLLDVRERLSYFLQRNIGIYNPSSMAQFMVDVQSLDRRLNAAGTTRPNNNSNSNQRGNYRGGRGGRGGWIHRGGYTPYNPPSQQETQPIAPPATSTYRSTTPTPAPPAPAAQSLYTPRFIDHSLNPCYACGKPGHRAINYPATDEAKAAYEANKPINRISGNAPPNSKS